MEYTWFRNHSATLQHFRLHPLCSSLSPFHLNYNNHWGKSDDLEMISIKYNKTLKLSVSHTYKADGLCTQVQNLSSHSSLIVYVLPLLLELLCNSLFCWRCWLAIATTSTSTSQWISTCEPDLTKTFSPLATHSHHSTAVTNGCQRAPIVDTGWMPTNSASLKSLQWTTILAVWFSSPCHYPPSSLDSLMPTMLVVWVNGKWDAINTSHVMLLISSTGNSTMTCANMNSVGSKYTSDSASTAACGEVLRHPKVSAINIASMLRFVPQLCSCTSVWREMRSTGFHSRRD